MLIKNIMEIVKTQLIDTYHTNNIALRFLGNIALMAITMAFMAFVMIITIITDGHSII